MNWWWSGDGSDVPTQTLGIQLMPIITVINRAFHIMFCSCQRFRGSIKSPCLPNVICNQKNEMIKSNGREQHKLWHINKVFSHQRAIRWGWHETIVFSSELKVVYDRDWIFTLERVLTTVGSAVSAHAWETDLNVSWVIFKRWIHQQIIKLPLHSNCEAVEVHSNQHFFQCFGVQMQGILGTCEKNKVHSPERPGGDYLVLKTYPLTFVAKRGAFGTLPFWILGRNARQCTSGRLLTCPGSVANMDCLRASFVCCF